MSVRIMVGDARDILATLPSGSVQCAVTSPPYFGLRSYLPDGHPDKALEVGAEQTPDAYIAGLVIVFREMRRVLADDGVFWLNIGDSYSIQHVGRRDHGTGEKTSRLGPKKDGIPGGPVVKASANRLVAGYKPKDLMMIPARVAIALQADGWYLRSHCIWHKPNPMPESVRDRPTNAHESVFLLTKNARYFYNAAAVAETVSGNAHARRKDGGPTPKEIANKDRNDGNAGNRLGPRSDGLRNMRNVWRITPMPMKAAHFATFPPELAARCIKAGSRPGDTILDPFFGAGTTALAAPDRDCMGIDINAAYADLASARLAAAGLSVTIEHPHQSAAELEAAE